MDHTELWVLPLENKYTASKWNEIHLILVNKDWYLIWTQYELNTLLVTDAKHPIPIKWTITFTFFSYCSVQFFWPLLNLNQSSHWITVLCPNPTHLKPHKCNHEYIGTFEELIDRRMTDGYRKWIWIARLTRNHKTKIRYCEQLENEENGRIKAAQQYSRSIFWKSSGGAFECDRTST